MTVNAPQVKISERDTLPADGQQGGKCIKKSSASGVMHAQFSPKQSILLVIEKVNCYGRTGKVEARG
jgi:hypothetical protein